MTQYELLDIWQNHLALGMNVFVAFLSATSAVLIVANLKGAELPKLVYRLVVALYSVAATFLILLYGKVMEAALDVRGQMLLAEMPWFNTVYEPQFVAPLVFGTGFIVQVLLAIGSLWYFRSTRITDV